MLEQGKWSAFTSATADLSKMAPRDMTRRCAQAIGLSQRFYLPHGADVLEGKAYADVMELLQLPFDCVAILSETWMNNEGVGQHGTLMETMTVAFNVQGPTNDALRWADSTTLPATAWCHLICLAKNPFTKQWVIGGPNIVVEKTAEGAIDWTITLDEYSRKLVKIMAPERLAREATNDVHVVTNLCVMLALKNVKTRDIAPPPKMQKSRALRGKLPLWSYHVLEVDGVQWDSLDEASDHTHMGYRSHLRRGHIRRLDEQRHVWVRAAFVHGKQPGFAAKDYRVHAL